VVDGLELEADIAARDESRCGALTRIVAQLVHPRRGGVLRAAPRHPGSVRLHFAGADPLGASGSDRSTRRRILRVPHPHRRMNARPTPAGGGRLGRAERQSLDLPGRLEELSHYELLGLNRLADDKAIRAGVLRALRVFHPIRFFGKTWAARPKLGKIFSRMTPEAYEPCLGRESRAEYARYLARGGALLDLSRQFFDKTKQAADNGHCPAAERHARKKKKNPPRRARRFTSAPAHERTAHELAAHDRAPTSSPPDA